MSRPRTPSDRLRATRHSLERHREYLALLQAVTEASNESESLDDVLSDVLAMICEALEWPIGHAMQVHPGESTLSARPSDSWYLAEPERHALLRAESERIGELALIDRAVEDREPRTFSELPTNARFRRREVAKELGLDNLVVGPILSGEDVVAVVEFFVPGPIDTRRESLEMLLASICSTVGRVAERERARAQHRQLARAEFMREQTERHAADLEQLAAELRRRNQELDQFAYVASHDLRAPLRGIANLASWLAQDLDAHLDDKSRRYLGLLQGRVERMEGLINGLLEYSRVGRKSAESEPVEVGALVREIVDLLAAQDKARWVLGELPTIETARTPLQQVLHNLLTNALKYGGGDQLQIEVAAEPCELGAGTPGWRFWVRDNGEGIAAKYHERVWQIFQTLQPRDKVESTGIGLALVRKIVEQQGGTVGLESEPGRGASFSFTWPATTNGT